MRNLPNSVQLDELDREQAQAEKQTAEMLRGYCEICGADLFVGDGHYCMPDSCRICTNPDCLEKWAKEYKNDII